MVAPSLQFLPWYSMLPVFFCALGFWLDYIIPFHAGDMTPKKVSTPQLGTSTCNQPGGYMVEDGYITQDAMQTSMEVGTTQLRVTHQLDHTGNAVCVYG